MTTTAKVFKYIGFGILGIGAMFLFVWLVMLLWNALIPVLFSGPVLSYWQAAGILILSKILLSGIGGSGNKKSKRGHYHGHSYGKSKWHSKYHDKYNKECCGEKEKVDPEVQPEA